MLSIVTPAFNEEKNLPVLCERILQVTSALEVEWEWVVVDDHSEDSTFDVIRDIASRDSHVLGVRLSKNSGSHTALICGLKRARGDCAVVMATDLQDPPEVIPQLFARWKSGAQVVWAVRESRTGESAGTVGFSGLYYWMMRHIVGLKEIPSKGADFFLVDRTVIEALNELRESNINLFALLTWIGFRQEHVRYNKEARLHGKSGWTMRKKFKLFIDSITSFSSFPIRLMSYIGFMVACLGFLYAAFVVYNKIVNGVPTEGWASLVVIILVLGGIQMIMMGVLGEYLWRTFDESRSRPRYFIEDET